MAQYFKAKEFNVNNELMDYFYLNDIKNYDVLYIISDEDYNKVFKDIDALIFSNLDNSISDSNPIYTNLKLLNNAKYIYLKDKINILDDDTIKDFIMSYKGIIICNSKLMDYLNDLNLIKDVYKVNKNHYLKIDKLGNIQELIINN